MKNSIFLKTCRGESTKRPPIWLMRQAGRYMKVYRDMREKRSLLELVKTPELAAEVTMQPIRAFGADAAIIFADILPLLQAMGLPLEFKKGEGPHIDTPIRNADDVRRLYESDVEDTLGFTLEAIKQVRPMLDTLHTPLIGFSGAPFTLAAYAVEGGSSRNFETIKAFMYTEPELFHELMGKISRMVSAYMKAQVKAGVHCLQLFDSWAGALSPEDYEEFVFPHNQAILNSLQDIGVPTIYFSTGTGAYLNLISDLNTPIFGLDWRVAPQAAKTILGPKRIIQGNLDPLLLMGSRERLEQKARELVATFRNKSGEYNNFIFNIGHGIHQHTPEDSVKHLFDTVFSS